MTRGFWRETAERAIKTAAQALLALLTVGVTVFDLDWVAALQISVTAAFASVLSSIASAGFGERGSPSLVRRPEGEP